MLTRALEVDLWRVKDVVFACMILHNICLSKDSELDPPIVPTSTSVDTVKKAVAMHRGFVRDMRQVYALTLQGEVGKERVNEEGESCWSKEKLKRRQNTKSMARDALANAVHDANLKRPERSTERS